MAEQIPFQVNSFADNPEPRCPCVLLLDVSGSMAGQPLAQLNAGLAQFKSELAADAMAMKRVELAVVTFGPVKVENSFTSPEFFNPVPLTAQKDTPMGAAITKAIELVAERKQELRANGIRYYRPWIFLITDGAPTDAWSQAAAAVREGEESKQFVFFPVGVGGADMDTLRKISVREPLSLDGLKFRELFLWLSASLGQVSRSMPGTEVALTSPAGWAKV